MPILLPQSQSFLETSTCFFEDAPISIWVEDFSAVKHYFDSLKEKGIQDVNTYLENHPEDVISLAQAVKVIDVNKRTLELYQATDKAELLDNLNKVFGKESYEAFKKELIALAEGKTTFSIKAFNLTLKGEGLFFLLKVAVPSGYENTLSRVLAYVIDVTISMVKEEDLRRTNDLYWKLFNFAPDATLVVDLATRIIIKANEAAERLLGIPAEQIVGMHSTDILPKEDREKYYEDFRTHLGKNQGFSDNIAIFNRASHQKILVSVSSNLVDIEGKAYIIGIFRALHRKAIIPQLKTVSPEILQRRLTEREREIVQLIATGCTSRQIAARLSISDKTVETHRARIMKKLDVHRTADLIRYAITSKLIE